MTPHLLTVGARAAVAVLALLTAAWSFSTGAADVSPPERLFRVTFNDLSANAEFARGDGASTLPRNLGLTSKPGVKGVSLCLQDDETCHYAVKDNLDVRAGTLSFWAKPQNWDDTEGRYQKFFWVYGREDGVPFSFYVDSPNTANNARLVISSGRRGESNYRLYQINAKADWSSGRWHKVDVTWSEKQLAIYVDGRIGQRLDVKDTSFPTLQEEVFRLVPIFHSGDGRFHNGKDRSFIDEVEIWSAPLSADRILERYLADTGGRLAPPLTTVPLVSTPIAVDGKLDDAGWAAAARVPIFCNTVTGFPHSTWAVASLCYDDKHLYVALSTPQDAAPTTRTTERDGPVWEDDSFELFLVADMQQKDAFFQFIVNSAGVLFDGRGGRREWDGDIGVKTHRGTRSWTVELAIPFETLGTNRPAAGDEWRANICRDYAREKPLQPVYTSWAYVGGSFLANQERWGRIRFGGAEDGVRLDLSPQLSAGTLGLEVGTATAGSRVAVHVKSSGETTTFEAMADAAGVSRVEERLEHVKEGVCQIEATTPDGEKVASLQTRFLVRESIQVDYVPYPQEKRLALLIDLSCVDDDWRQPVADGKTVLRLTVVDPEGSSADHAFPLAGTVSREEVPFEFTEGTYRMLFHLEEPGHSQPLLTQRSLEIPDLPWVGTQAGVTDQVLDPWTPLRFGQGATVSCWGRGYTFDGPFLSRAVNQGRDMLTGPVTLQVKTPADTVGFTATQTRTVMEAEHRAEYEGNGVFADTGINVQWSMWTEYDGLSVVRVTLKPAAGAPPIRQLLLHVPLRPDVVRCIRGRKSQGGIRSGRTDWDGVLWEGGYEPFVWVVNEDEGFLVFCENEANWVYDEGAKIVAVRGGPDAGISLRLISRETPADRELTYRFGFQATPVKPLMKERREWNFDMHRDTPYQNARNWFTQHAQLVGTWKVHKPDVLREFDRSLREKGVRLLYYGVTSCTPDRNPTYDLFRKLWDSPYPASYGPYTYSKNPWQDPHPPYRQASVSPGSPTFQDMMLYYAEEMLRDIGVAGLYTDTDGVWPCDNQLIGSKFTDAFGKTGVTYTILSKRRFAKRMAAIVRTVGGERRYWMTHSHAKLVPPVHAWADFWLPGEELTHQLYGNKWFYVDTLDDSYFRQEFRGQTSGLVHIVLPEFIRGTKNKADGEGPQPTESLLAMCAVTDTVTSGAYLNSEALGVYWTLRHDLGIIHSSFAGYWQTDCPVNAVTDRALASYYQGKNRHVVAVANRLAEDAEIAIELDVARMGLNGKGLALADARTGRALALDDSRVTVRIPQRNYTFITLTPAVVGGRDGR